MKDMLTIVDENINWLASFGQAPEGGVTRTLYSESWIAAQNALKDKFESIGLETNYDAVGNLFGKVKGTKFPDEVILSGSHIDTVKNGGKLDGQYGVIGAYLAIQYLMETYGPPLRSLSVVSFAEEEGSRFPYAFWGSKNVVGIADPADVADIVDGDGVRFVDAMKKAGFSFPPPAKTPSCPDAKAFLELHIEQGSVLERNHQPIGIVTSIVGQRRYGVKLTGQANHAGTTPMDYRKDAIYGFSCICHEAILKAKAEGDPLVLTFGRVTPVPNVVNVVPGGVEFTIDCRHTDKTVLTRFTETLVSDMERIAKEHGLGIEIELWMDEDPVPMDPTLTEGMKHACEAIHLDYRVMHSGAGHDSQIVAPVIPTGMIFVPSIEGISHNPLEASHIEDLTNGVKVLAQAMYQLAYL